MSRISFSIANSFLDYEYIKKYVDVVFCNKKYEEGCLILEDLNLFEVFKYFYIQSKNDYFCYINSKSSIYNEYNLLLNDNEIYLNYYNNYIYYLKYSKKLYCLFELFLNELNQNNFLSFLDNCFVCLGGKINCPLNNKVVYPKNKLIYNAVHEKFKNKSYKS